jgi:hypothetical protein
MLTRFPKISSARQIVILAGLLVVTYIFWIGPERFFIESFGTWLLSPAIYPRLLPDPWKGWLLKALVFAPWSGLLVQAVPVLMLLAACGAAAAAILKNSILLAMGLTLTVFSVYHCLQPLGITWFTD